jgi:leucine-rich repeat protein SHOC2
LCHYTYIIFLIYLKCLDGKWLQHLTSLENLEIAYGRKLESLPEEGLPSSLSVLTIKWCPLLEANCNSNGGKEWPKIAHIPCLIITRQVIIWRIHVVIGSKYWQLIWVTYI